MSGPYYRSRAWTALRAARRSQRSRGKPTPHAKGAAADGTPLDPGYWWHA